MDRSYYYRVLGAREGASAQQIKQAYEERVKRLKSPDYADDSEYVDRKLKEASEAYRVVLGGSAPSAAKQRKKSYEKLKNSMEKTVSSIFDSKEAKSALGIAVSVLVAVITLAVGSCDTYSSPDYSYEDTAYMESSRQAVERILNRSEEYDFFGHLDDNVSVPDEKIEWDITYEIRDKLWGLNIDLCSALDIFSLEDAVCWYMDDDDYYYEASDYEISQLLAEIMGAPIFEEVAGMTVTDTDVVITDYCDYMQFLIEIAGEQTDGICGATVEYSY